MCPNVSKDGAAQPPTNGVQPSYLGYNNFTGELPSSFKSLQALKGLSLSGTSLNNLSSALVTLQHCNNLHTLFLSASFKDEVMPGNIDLQFESLMALVISNSHLKGSIKSWLSSGFPNLRVLDLSGNRLSGTIPSWIGEFPLLHYLDLSNNSFTGVVPQSLTELQSLRDLTSADFSSFLTKLSERSSTVYSLQGISVPTLDLSNNELTGPIWPSFGNLTELSILRMRNNSLSGSIPRSISRLSRLWVLDLSYSNLSGDIPESLKELHLLSIFIVSYNKLSGKVPQGGQLDTFTSSSY
ncbi:hypothetical protein CRG98_032426 [Punica granatum]|uniref:Uncharacterized protein n=1 Tax=Punica granatum TaxID=22663 RepID=A0A2I0IT89_PUNGR|nr:hypothetical protein CRG98_032426 [Punica granatum]